jgi:hypothetical protein
MISIQTLHDVLIALGATAGIAVAYSVAFMAAGAIFKRDQARTAKARGPVAPSAQPQLDQDRELARR